MIWLLLEYELVLTDFLKRHGSEALEFRLDRLARMGNACREPVSRHIGDGIWELRANSPQGQLRVFYFFGPGVQQITALHCVVKKRRKTDPSDIALAKKRRSRVLEREVRINVYALRN